MGWLKGSTGTIEKEKALTQALAHIEKQFGAGAIMTLGQRAVSDGSAVIKTGALSLDLALGVGGIPLGRIVEVYGGESSGKTTLAMHIAAEAQKEGGIVAYIDAEHAFDPEYGVRLGLNASELLISQPDSAEDALNIVETLVRSGALALIVVDSVAALVPESELAGEIGDASIGVQARLMSQALRKLASLAAKSGTTILFINQLREKIGVFFGNPEVTPGGRALKFYATLRIETKRIETIKGLAGQDKGIRVRARVTKNKVAPPFRLARFDILFAQGIVAAGSVLDLAVDLNLIEKRGAWFSFEGVKLGQGRDAARDELQKKPDLLVRLENLIREEAKKGNLPLITCPNAEKEEAADLEKDRAAITP